MNTIFRILLILVVASIVGGLMFTAVSALGSTAQSPIGEFRPEGGRPEGDRESGGVGGFSLPFGVVKSFVVISIVAAFYFNGSKLFSGKKKVSALIS